MPCNLTLCLTPQKWGDTRYYSEVSDRRSEAPHRLSRALDRLSESQDSLPPSTRPLRRFKQDLWGPLETSNRLSEASNRQAHGRSDRLWVRLSLFFSLSFLFSSSISQIFLNFSSISALCCVLEIIGCSKDMSQCPNKKFSKIVHVSL